CRILSPNTPTTQLSTHSLHDALPISGLRKKQGGIAQMKVKFYTEPIKFPVDGVDVVAASSKVGIVVIYYEERLPKEAQLRAVERSEEHTSELQSRFDLVCRLLLE